MSENGKDRALDDLFWRDEILQIMYWMRGEGLGEAVTPEDLVVFLPAGAAAVRAHLERLVREGYMARAEAEAPQYRLTALGKEEGARRFADAFEGWNKQAHGVCNNPQCACHKLGPAACESGTHSHAGPPAH